MRAELADLESELADAYRRELTVDASAVVIQRRDALDRELRATFDRTVERISEIVAASAPDRAKLIVRVALISGWPAVAVRSADEVRRSKVLQNWAEEAGQLRERIREHDERVDAHLSALLNADATMTEAERARIAREVKAILDKVDGEAKRLAAERIAETNRADLPDLIGPASPAAAVQPSQTAVLPGASGHMSSAAPAGGIDGERDVLRARLDIFLRVRGYKLALTSHGSVDKTAEFIAWLKDHSVGP